MNMVMTILSVGYICYAVMTTKHLWRYILEQLEEMIAEAKKDYQEILLKKGDIYSEKKSFEEKSAEIFILYELTKDLTKNFNEDEAWAVFENKLKENILCQACRLLDPLSEDIKAIQTRGDCFVFPLQEKKRLLAYLVVQGLAQGDKEKVTILANQFALALRRIRLYKESEDLAMTDSLTGVHTRRYILERLQEELRRAQARNMNMSLLMVDVDHFKRINDHHGHLTGDQVLREIARLIRENIREIDVVGRYGGEEFCVILPDTDSKGAGYVAERIRSSVEKALIKAYDTTLKATISIGLAAFPYDGKSIEEILDKADWALYRAKMNGRNVVCAFGIYKKPKEHP